MAQKIEIYQFTLKVASIQTGLYNLNQKLFSEKKLPCRLQESRCASKMAENIIKKDFSVINEKQ